jgi:hypothetical protein
LDNKIPSPNALTGIKAAQRGNFREALTSLQTAIAAGDSHRDVLMAAAFSARAVLNFDYCLETIDRYLLIDPKDINANLIKADALTGLGKTNAAFSFYVAAIRLAPDVSELPEAQAKEIRRAQAACDAATKYFEKHMSSYLDEIGFKDSGGTTRIEQTVDIMMGRKQAYHQNPSKLYIPELPHKQFYDPSDFDWAESLLSKAGDIKQELQSVMEDGTLFSPYVDHNPDAPALSNTGLENDSRWSAFHLVKDGLPIESNIKRCPKTYGALAELPIANINGRSPNILFSSLEAGAHIPPHHGQMNARLLVHLPLIVPNGCELRVGNQIRSVVEYKLMIFDDSIEHEARNTSDRTRIVLIFDIWRPELSNEERKVISGIFERISSIE